MSDNVKLVIEASREEDGKRKLSCAAAWRLSKEEKIPLKEIGRICNEQKIRITDCQLGCFK